MSPFCRFAFFVAFLAVLPPRFRLSVSRKPYPTGAAGVQRSVAGLSTLNKLGVCAFFLDRAAWHASWASAGVAPKTLIFYPRHGNVFGGRTILGLAPKFSYISNGLSPATTPLDSTHIFAQAGSFCQHLVLKKEKRIMATPSPFC